MPHPVLDPSKSKVDGLAFLGLSLARNHHHHHNHSHAGGEDKKQQQQQQEQTTIDQQGHPESYTHQTAFDLNDVLDRDYEFLSSTNDDGWLVGGGEPGPPQSYKLAATDSAHVELMRIGTYRKEWGGLELKELLRTLTNDSNASPILIPQIEVVPTDVTSNLDTPTELELRFDMETQSQQPQPPQSSLSIDTDTTDSDSDHEIRTNLTMNDFETFCQAPLPLNWQLRFIHNQLFHTFVFPSRFCPGAFHATITRNAEFRSKEHQKGYFKKCDHAIAAWRRKGPQPLNTIPRSIDGIPLPPITEDDEDAAQHSYRLQQLWEEEPIIQQPPTKNEDDADIVGDTDVAIAVTPLHTIPRAFDGTPLPITEDDGEADEEKEEDEEKGGEDEESDKEEEPLGGGDDTAIATVLSEASRDVAASIDENTTTVTTTTAATAHPSVPSLHQTDGLFVHLFPPIDGSHANADKNTNTKTTTTATAAAVTTTTSSVTSFVTEKEEPPTQAGSSRDEEEKKCGGETTLHVLSDDTSPFETPADFYLDYGDSNDNDGDGNDDTNALPLPPPLPPAAYTARATLNLEVSLDERDLVHENDSDNGEDKENDGAGDCDDDDDGDDGDGDDDGDGGGNGNDNGDDDGDGDGDSDGDGDGDVGDKHGNEIENKMEDEVDDDVDNEGDVKVDDEVDEGEVKKEQEGNINPKVFFEIPPSETAESSTSELRQIFEHNPEQLIPPSDTIEDSCTSSMELNERTGLYRHSWNDVVRVSTDDSSSKDKILDVLTYAYRKQEVEDLLDETAAAAISVIATAAAATTTTTTTDGTKGMEEGATDLPGIIEEEQEMVTLSSVTGGMSLDIDHENDGDVNGDVNVNNNDDANDDVNDGDIDGDANGDADDNNDDNDNANDNDNDNDDSDDSKVDGEEIKTGSTKDEEVARESTTEQGISLLTTEEDKDKEGEGEALSSATTMEENNNCHSGLWFCTGHDNNDDAITVEGEEGTADPRSSKEEEEEAKVEEVAATEQVPLVVTDEEDEQEEKLRELSSSPITITITTPDGRDIYIDRENDDDDDDDDDNVKVEVEEEEEGKAGRNKEEEEAGEEVGTEQMLPLVQEKEDDEKEKPRACPSATTTTTKVNDIGADRENDDETNEEKEVEESKVVNSSREEEVTIESATAAAAATGPVVVVSAEKVEEEKKTTPLSSSATTTATSTSTTTTPSTKSCNCHSGIWLFTDRENPTHFFKPNFLPPYDTIEKRRIIFDVLKEEWDETSLSFKPYMTKRKKKKKATADTTESLLSGLPTVDEMVNGLLRTVADGMCSP